MGKSNPVVLEPSLALLALALTAPIAAVDAEQGVVGEETEKDEILILCELIPMTHPAFGDVEEVGQQVGVTAWLEHQQAAVYSASSQRRGKLS